MERDVLHFGRQLVEVGAREFHVMLGCALSHVY